MKTCTVCKELKTLDNYHNSKNSKDGKGYRCRPCDLKARQKYREDNKESAAISARRRLLWFRYKLTPEDYEAMFTAQDSKCAICKATENRISGTKWSFAVDHCHETGKVRGLLCNQCNRALGMFQDSIDILETATAYLKSYK